MEDMIQTPVLTKVSQTRNAIMPIMPKRRIPFELLFLLPMFVACTTSKAPPDINGVILPSECRNACWAGIEPGVTDNEQTLNILTKRYGAKNITTEIVNNQIFYMRWVSGNQDLSKSGTVYFAENKVSEVGINFKDGLEVQELIESIGEPDFVNGVIGEITLTGEYRCAGIVLTYPEFGLMIDLLPYKHNLGVYETQFVTFLRIRKPWDRKDIPWTDSFNIPWNGYHEYCQTPSITFMEWVLSYLSP